jgi:hypothetical protein
MTARGDESASEVTSFCSVSASCFFFIRGGDSVSFGWVGDEGGDATGTAVDDEGVGGVGKGGGESGRSGVGWSPGSGSGSETRIGGGGGGGATDSPRNSAISKGQPVRFASGSHVFSESG